jgi:hypothetical protein
MAGARRGVWVSDLRKLVAEMEDLAAAYGTRARDPLERGRGRHTRTNRVKLSSLSCGLNEAAQMLEELIDRKGGKAR